MPTALASIDARTSPGPRWVRLLAADPELADGIPARERAAAEQVVRAEARTLERGAWRPSLTLDSDREAWALLVLDGVIVQECTVADRVSTQLLGPGDLVRPQPAAETFLTRVVRWKVLEPAEVAVLDDRFELAARRWPSLSRHVADRLLAQNERVALQLAIAQLPRIEQRLIGMLWHLASRWGRVAPDGCLVPLRLTHEALGQLVGARRPTVSLALAELAGSGQVRRRPDGTWILDRRSVEELAADPGGAQALERAG